MIGTIDCIDVHGNLTELKVAPSHIPYRRKVPAVINNEATARGYEVLDYSVPDDNGMYKCIKLLPTGNRMKVMYLGLVNGRYVARYE